MSVTEDGRTRLRAFDQFITKLSSRCNLCCDYCYVYELRDSGWRQRPRIMSAPVREQLVSRIAEHARRHGLDRVRVLLHGGEPLLAGPRVIADFTTAVRRAVQGTGTEVDFALQTNGVLLTEALLDLLLELDVQVGVSLDGYAEAHDRHRRGPGSGAGKGSHARVTAALALLGGARYRPLFGGLLCTIDPANDPVRTFDALAAHRPPAADFLLPHGTWDHPPTGGGGDGALYGAWLCAVHDRWRAAGRPMRVRLFESIDSLSRYGGGSSSEVLGTVPAAAVAIETDGTVAWTESLNAVAEGAAHTGGTIFSHSFDALLGLDSAPEDGVGSLCRRCRECPLVQVCGGGLRAHRFGRGRGFANPSVYCKDISALIRHITSSRDQ
ncbi:FxsB family cyclophane-forming radical SAM/SPASM peptide maturase [Streptomyces coeruleorubidus]|uniref:FxsB family cyclophane-forming radical SAM/SPASM peptide maturase n=1 Tax=Streptomyces coeruleorubidus TaxID=116188 RepID=UPI001E614E5E|nr:FxsB family cyclophane-forming radical SAM/SPASM peptide maturase [Streptomyces coeruleorubidus]